MTRNRPLALLALATLAILVALGATLGTAQGRSDTGIIHGQVTSGPSQPVAGAWVIAETEELSPSVRKFAVTNRQGRFVIRDLPEAEYGVWVRGDGIRESGRTTVQVRRQGQGPPLNLSVEATSEEWSIPNGNLWNHRRADSRIDASNVDQLEVAWTRELTAQTAYGAFASSPLIFDGTAYLQELNSNVAAVDVETGETKWTREYNENVIGPNGLTLYQGTLYGVTRTTVFALDPADGSELWRRPVLEGGRHFSIAPMVADGRVYAGTITRAGGGIIFVLDAETGDTLWTFNTLKDPSVIPNVGAGGVWYTPLVHPEGSVYYGTGNAYHTPRFALENPDEILYTNSLLKLNSRSGDLQWYFQGVPNDFYDWDMHLPAIYTDDLRNPVILHGGKMGYVYAFNPDDGTLLWKTPVGLHTNNDEDSRRALEEPGSVVIEPPLTLAPGVYGGINSPMAYQDGVVYVAVANLATTLSDLDVNYGGATGTFQFEGNTGEMVALDVATGEILWSTDLPGMAFGAATISNDLVFTTSFDGKVFALSREDGSIVWQDQLPSVVNAPVTIAGDTLITAHTEVFGADPPEQSPRVVAYRLGASGPSSE